MDDARFGFSSFAEQWNGRLAMMGFVIGLSTELLTGQGILQQIGLGWKRAGTWFLGTRNKRRSSALVLFGSCDCYFWRRSQYGCLLSLGINHEPQQCLLSLFVALFVALPIFCQSSFWVQSSWSAAFLALIALRAIRTSMQNLYCRDCILVQGWWT